MSSDPFGLRENPFGETPDMRQVYRSPSYLDALTSLYEGILAGHRILILVANAGMGKTTLLRDLNHRLDRVARTLFLSVLDYEPHDLLRCLLARLGSDDDDQDLARLRNRLSEILEAATSELQRSVLFIDEAHGLQNSALESLLVLSNSARPCARSVQMVIAGQPQLLEKLACPELAQFQTSVAVIAGLRSLSRSEVKQYINYRVRLSIYRHNGFTLRAQTLIAKRSKGIPARINALCSAAAYYAENKPVDAPSVRKAISASDIGAHHISPRLHWLTFAGSIVLFLAFTAMFSYLWLIPRVAVSMLHGISRSREARSVTSNSSARNVVSVESRSPVNAETAKRLPKLTPGSSRTTSSMAAGKQSSFETIIVAASASRFTIARRTKVVSELRRGDEFMKRGHYKQAIRAFKAALALGADSRDVSTKIDGARRAEATERRVLQ